MGLSSSLRYIWRAAKRLHSRGFRQMPRSIFQLLVAAVIDDAFSQPFRLVMLVLLSNHVKRDWMAGFAGEVAVERMTGIEPA